MFNDLYEYVVGLKWVIKMLLEEYVKIGLQKDGKYLQINSNILQIENEFYVLICLKCVICWGEILFDVLLCGGIEYIEVCLLDINLFLLIGVDVQQVCFFDLFMVWCVLVDVLEMSSDELLCICINWNWVILEGCKLGLMLGIGCESVQFLLVQVGKDLFCDLCCVVQILDSIYGGQVYQQVCDELLVCFDDLELIFLVCILCFMIEEGIGGIGCVFVDCYWMQLCEELLEILSEDDFIVECDVLVV